MHEPRTPTTSVHAGSLLADYLEATAQLVHRRLGDVVGVAVSTEVGGTPRTLGASTELAATVDRIQFEIGTGPCLHALESGEDLYVPSLADDDRWGDYGPRAGEVGALSCVSVPILVDARPVAVFKAYAGVPDGLDEHQRATAHLVAGELAGGFRLAEHLADQAADLDDMTALMAHRRVIDLALGISMERAQVSAETAFGLLRAQSQHRNVKLHDVAADVVRSVPGGAPDDVVAHFNPHG